MSQKKKLKMKQYEAKQEHKAKNIITGIFVSLIALALIGTLVFATMS